MMRKYHGRALAMRPLHNSSPKRETDHNTRVETDITRLSSARTITNHLVVSQIHELSFDRIEYTVRPKATE